MPFLKVSCSHLRLVNAVLAATLNQAKCPFELKLAYAHAGIDCVLLSYDTDIPTHLMKLAELMLIVIIVSLGKNSV